MKSSETGTLIRYFFALIVGVLICSLPLQSNAQNTSGSESFLESVGFFADINFAYDIRFNGYSTYEPLLQNSRPVSFSTKELSVVDLSVETGLLYAPFINFEYTTSVPRTDFQQQALAFREDNTKGLEKYTLGVNTAPLWDLIFPKNSAGFIKWILSGKYRRVRELTQASATVDEPSLFLTGMNGQSPTFNQASAGAPYSFTSKYKYSSFTWPLLSNYDNNSEKIKGNFAIFIGYARWDFDRSYANFFPDYANQVVYRADVATQAATAEMHISSRRNFEQNRGWGFAFRLVYGYGIRSTFAGANADLEELFNQEVDITNQNYEVEFSYKQFLFRASDKVDMYIQPGLDAKLFWTSFEDYREPSVDKNFNKIDYILTPQVEISVKIL